MNIPSTLEEEEKRCRTVVVSGIIEENDEYTVLVLEVGAQGVISTWRKLGEGILALELESTAAARRVIAMGGKGDTPLGVFVATWGTGYLPVVTRKKKGVQKVLVKPAYDLEGYMVPGYIGRVTRECDVQGVIATKKSEEVVLDGEGDTYQMLLQEKQSRTAAAAKAKEQLLAERKRQREQEEIEKIAAKKRKDEAEAALALDALQRRLRFHMDTKEEALQEETEEEKMKREVERKKQEEQFRLANEEKLAKLNKQKEEKARAKAEEKAKKEAIKKQKTEEKRLKQAYKDYSAGVVEKKKKGVYKPSPWSVDVEKEFVTLYKTMLPGETEELVVKVRLAYLYHREITAALKMHLCTISTDTPADYLKVLTELFKQGGILLTETFEKTPDILAKLFDTASSTKIEEAKKVVTGWKDLLSAEQHKTAVATITAMHEAQVQKENEERERAEREKAMQMNYYQYQYPAYPQAGQQYPYPQQGLQQGQYQYPAAPHAPAPPIPAALPPNWVELHDAATNRPYYHNSVTRETSWVTPTPQPPV